MIRSHAAVAFLVTLVLCPYGSAQGEDPKEVSKEVARAAQKEFTSEYKSKDAKQRLAAVDRLTPYKHDLIVKCLDKAMRDREGVVRAAAASRLGKQNKKAALRILSKAFKDRRNEKSTEAMVGILEAFRSHQRSPALKDMKSLFNKASKEVQREVVLTLRYSRSKDTVKFLGLHLDMPQPKNVDSPSNPPASYWKDKVTRWNYWFEAVTASLTHLTGQEFDESRQIRGWLKSSAKIVSIEDGEKALKGL